MKKTCKWTIDEWDGSYDTECLEKFFFDYDGPKENKFVYCPYCGKKIRENKC